MSGTGEPMATEAIADDAAPTTAAARITFEGVRVQTLDEDGATKDKFPGDRNSLRAEYDPVVRAIDL
jgi:hypothetical protein